MFRKGSYIEQNLLAPLRTLQVRKSIIATTSIGFLFLLAAFVVNAWIYHRAGARLEENEYWVAHTHEVLTQVVTLLSTAKDAETGQRGYLITGREEYLQPYYDARRRIGDEISSLRQLVSDNPAQVQRVDLARDLVNRRFAVLDEVIQTRRSSGEAAARELMLSGTGAEYMNRLRSVVAEMEGEEHRLLQLRAANTQASHNQADYALLVASLTGLALVIVVFFMVSRHIASLVREREAEQAARLGDAKLKGIIGSAMDAIISVDQDQKIVLFNEAAEKIFRCSARDAIGSPLDRFIPERFREGHHNHVRDFGKAGVTTRSMHSPGVLAGLRSDGDEFPIEATISQIQVGEDKIYTVILRDITDRKRTEEQLQQAQKMEAIGRLAGGVAHDFNNLLNIVLGYSELLQDALPDLDHRREWVEQIANAANTGALLTRQLLAFSRKRTLTPQSLDLATAVHDIEPMLRRLLREDIEFTVRTSEDTCPIKADPGHIQQLLLNLVANARDAMPDGGNLTIEVRNVELDETYIRQHRAVAAGNYVMLAVSDTGMGMEPEIVERIFEPFFTTKSTGKGTGLGLATVYGIVKQNGGDIWVYSEPGIGTVFKVYLPRLAAFAAIPKPAISAKFARSGSETLLLVEDSPPLRHLTREVLSKAGYRVLEAGDGVEALELSSNFEGDIDLLLTDIVMPRKRGPELARELVRLRPSLRVIFMSGYSEEVLSQESLDFPMNILEKPYTSEDLLRVIREVLDSSDMHLKETG